MQNNYTSLDTSKKLFEAGIKAQSLTENLWIAYHDGVLSSYIGNITLGRFDVPAYSIADLLNALPKKINIPLLPHNKKIGTLFMSNFPEKIDEGWYVMYAGQSVVFEHEQLVEALAEMVLWCADNGFLDLKKEE